MLEQRENNEHSFDDKQRLNSLPPLNQIFIIRYVLCMCADRFWAKVVFENSTRS